MSFAHHIFDWDVSFLAHEELRTKSFGITREAKTVRYPVRLLRYWFGYHLLREEARRIARPLDVAEIGVHTGQMLTFLKTGLKAEGIAEPEVVRSWVGVDAILKTDRLRKAGYTEFQEGNLEDETFRLDAPCDAAVCLHVLEHLYDPEAVLVRLAKDVRPGGVIIGGFPVVPGPVRGIRENQVRRTAQPMGHVSVFSPGRVKRMAREAGLVLEFSKGAFCIRRKGMALENSAAWLRFNLLWGAVFNGWPGEIYWLMRKPGDAAGNIGRG